MFFNSHIATGYVAGKLLNNEKLFILLWIFSNLIPDIDGLWSKTVAGHHGILHTPIFWFFICLLIWLYGYLKSSHYIMKISKIVFFGTFLHLLTDWVTARTVGIKWLYPISDTDFYLFAIDPQKGDLPIYEMIINPYINFYFENKMLLISEIIINILAIFIFIKNFKYEKRSFTLTK